MICPQCKTEKAQKITDDDKRFYCPSCNHSWCVGQENKQGTLAFEGVPEAQRIFQMIVRDQEWDPALRAMIETQITTVIMDQWLEGFKAGQMASILYAKDAYGKDRNDSKGTTDTSNSRAGEVGERSAQTQHGETRRGLRRKGEESFRAEGNNRLLKDRVNGIEVEQIILPGQVINESINQTVAELSECNRFDRAEYDGHKLWMRVRDVK